MTKQITINGITLDHLVSHNQPLFTFKQTDEVYGKKCSHRFYTYVEDFVKGKDYFDLTKSALEEALPDRPRVNRGCKAFSKRGFLKFAKYLGDKTIRDQVLELYFGQDEPEVKAPEEPGIQEEPQAEQEEPQTGSHFADAFKSAVLDVVSEGMADMFSRYMPVYFDRYDVDRAELLQRVIELELGRQWDGKLMARMSQEILEVREEVETLKNPGPMTCVKYMGFRDCGQGFEAEDIKYFGILCGQYCREKGLVYKNEPHVRWGSGVNKYPLEALDACYPMAFLAAQERIRKERR